MSGTIESDGQPFVSAGIISILSAITGIISYIISLITINLVAPALYITEKSLEMLSLILFVYIYVRLKRLINEITVIQRIHRAISSRINKLLLLVIWSGVILGILTLLIRNNSSALFISPGMFMLLISTAMVVHGIICIIFGINLLKLGDAFNNLIKYYSYNIIAVGISLASFVLILLYPVINIMSGLLLATIFLTASTKLTRMESTNNTSN